jgi:hypothetical protein
MALAATAGRPRASAPRVHLLTAPDRRRRNTARILEPIAAHPRRIIAATDRRPARDIRVVGNPPAALRSLAAADNGVRPESDWGQTPIRI